MFRRLSNHPKRLTTAALALFCAVLGVALLERSSVPGAALARTSYDSYFRWFDLAEGTPSNCPLAIVYLDLESHLKQRQDDDKPWPRELHARLVRRLKSAGAKVVLFDIVFDSPGPDPAADRALADALRDHGNAMLAGELSVSSQSSGEGAWGRTIKLVTPLEMLRNAAAGWGLSEVGVDDDFAARQHFTGRAADGEPHPSLTWAAAGRLQLESVQGEERRREERWLRYYGPPFTLPHVSFSQALNPDGVDDSVFRDKIVFIGARPMAGLFKERRDEFRSPFHSWRERDLFMPGVEVHATQMLNLLRGDWLRRAAPRQEKAAAILWGVMAAIVFMRLRPVPASLAALIAVAALAAAAVGLFVQNGLWFPWLVGAAAQIPAALGGSILYHSLEWYRARRRFEAAKRIADARIREQAALIEKAQDGILVTDLDGKITYANPAAEHLCGRPREPLHGRPISELFIAAAVADARRTTLQQGEWRGELSRGDSSSRPLHIESRWTLLRDPAGQPQGLLLINTDVTEKKQLEAEANRMQRMEALGALAGGMAHDLNNALAPILMGTQLLRRDSKDENTRRVLSLMESSTRRGADMVRQVLLFARGRRGEFEPLNAGPLVKEMEKLARDTFPKSISISSHVAGDLWPVLGDTTQLHQVLLNLSVNARDAMPSGGALDLSADNVTLHPTEAATIPGATAGEFVVVMVSDTGTGMNSEVKARLFEPFFTTKAEGKGTGLGLSTTARIVKAHGGFMAVQSAPGEGTTFEVYLPRQSVTTRSEETGPQPALPRGQGQLILVADDDAAVRELLRRSLLEFGYQVATATNGAEAVAFAREHRDDLALVICDTAMPLLDGPGAIVEMQSIRPSLPALLIGGGEVSSGGNTGRNSHLAKPIALETLLSEVDRLINGG